MSVRSAVLAGLVGLSLGVTSGRADEPAVALVGGTVHLGTGEVLEQATVVLRGRRIEAVGKVELPPGCQQIDARGRHVYPGFLDANTVLGLVEIGSVTGTIDTDEVGRLNPSLRAELAVHPDSELFPAARTGGVLLALTWPRSGLVAGTSALIRTDGWTWEDMTVRAPVFLHVRWPGMALDRSGRAEKGLDAQREEREKTLAQLDEVWASARVYARAREERPGEVDVDLQWEAMREVFAGTLPVAIEAEDALQIRAALDWAERQGVRAVIVGGAEAWRLADELARRDVPVILGPTQRLPRRDWEGVDAPYANAARLHQAGVRLAFSTGGSAFAAANVRNLRLQAAQCLSYGLPREAAIHALTLGAAVILGVADRVGSIEAGREATLVVWDGDALETASRPLRAWIAGQETSLEDRQLKLYERYRARPRR